MAGIRRSRGGWTAAGVALALVPAGARAQSIDWTAVNEWLNGSGYTDQQRRNIERQLQNMEKNMAKVQAAQAKQTTKQSLENVKQMYEKAKKALEEQNLSAAYLYYSSICSSAIPGAEKMVQEARAKVLEIEAMAQGKVEEAEILMRARQEAAAAEILIGVVEGFPYTEAAKRAKSRLRSLMSYPRVAAGMRFSEAKAQEDAENYGEAVRIYEEVARRWPRTVPALKAEACLKRLKADPEKMAVIEAAKLVEAERVCPSLLTTAKNFIVNAENTESDQDRREFLSKARERLDRIVTEYSASTYAEEARTLLERMGAPAPGGPRRDEAAPGSTPGPAAPAAPSSPAEKSAPAP